jgi:hypothetical protein
MWFAGLLNHPKAKQENKRRKTRVVGRKRASVGREFGVKFGGYFALVAEEKGREQSTTLAT